MRHEAAMEMGITLRPKRLKRLSLWLYDRSYFADLVKALATLGNVDLCVAVARLPAHPRGEVHVTGWVPAASQKKLIQRMDEATRGQYELTFSDPGTMEEVPSLLGHVRFLKPFEKLVESFGVPSYDEIDPTWFMVLSFMLVFSFMFADVGHGLILTSVGIAVYIIGRKTGEAGGIAEYVLQSGGLLIVCGLAGTIGGILLGEAFGYHVYLLPHKITLPKPLGITLPFSPIQNPMQMFRLALLIGALHISSGLLLNIAKKLITHKFRAAFFEAFCWLWFYAGLMYSVFQYGLNLLAVTGDPIMLWGIMMPLTLMLLGRLGLEGIDGFVFFVEAVISTVSNTISYLRILALALAHSIISSLILEVGGHNLFVAIVGSLPALALEGLIVFIHTTRLAWVEWFSKFYHGGGTAFQSRVVFDWEIYGLEPPFLEAVQVVAKQHST